MDHRQPPAGTSAGRWLTDNVAVVTVEVIHGHVTRHLPAEVTLIFHSGRRFGQLPGVRLTPWTIFIVEEAMPLFFLELTLALDLHLPSLLTPLLPELAPVD